MSDPGDIGGGGPTGNKAATLLAIAEAQTEFMNSIGLTNEALKLQIKLDDDLKTQAKAREDTIRDLERAMAEQNEQAEANARAALANQDKLLQQQKALNDSFSQGAKGASDLAAAVLGIGQGPQTGFGRLVSNSAKLGSFTQAANSAYKGFATTLKDAISPLNVNIMLADKLYEGLTAVAAANFKAAIEQDALITQFNKVTGTTGQFNAELQNLSGQLLGVGIGQAGTVAAFQSLFKTVRGFADLTPEARSEITQTTALLAKMGFDAGAQAQNILFLSNSMGASATEAAQFNTRLASLANELDMPIGELVQGFEQAKGVLGASAQSTEELAEQFGLLAAQADATNLSIGKLIGVARKFDTFESAAQQVGTLNSVLGGPFLSTVQMIEATNPADRIQAVATAIQDAGLSFDEMGYYQRQVIANAAGLEDVNDLALLMAGNLEDLTPPEMDAQSIIEMKAQQKDFNTVMESFNNILQSTVISLGPVVQLIEMLANGVQFIVEGIMNVLSTPLGKVFLGGVGIAALIALSGPILAMLTALAPVLPYLAGAVAVGGIGQLIPGDDVLSGPTGSSGRGGRVLLGPEGAISLNNRDTVMAGTNLTRAATRTPATSGGSTAAAGGPVNMNISLSIDGQEIKTIVNSVKVDSALNPNLYNSIAGLISRGDRIV